MKMGQTVNDCIVHFHLSLACGVCSDLRKKKYFENKRFNKVLPNHSKRRFNPNI